MRDPIHIHIEDQFPDVKISHKLPLKSTYRISYAKPTVWKNKHFTITRQNFDAKDACLSLWEIDTKIDLSFLSDFLRRNLLWLFQLDGDIEFRLASQSEEAESLRHQHYNIMYSPNQPYQVDLAPGHYLTFLFIINRHWFLRQDAETYPHFKDFRKFLKNKADDQKLSNKLSIHYQIKKELTKLLNLKQQDRIPMELSVYQSIWKLIALSHKDLQGPAEENSYILATTAREIIVDYIKNEDRFSISELAEVLSVSHKHLTNVHKTHYKQTLVHFQKHMKLKEGMRLLKEGARPTEVAYRLNLHPSTFSKNFLEAFGISPKDVLRS